MAKLSFKYIPLTFISSQKEIQRQIRNTIVFSYLNNKYNDVREFSEILVSTQYGLNAAANDSGQHKFLRISDIKEGEVNWDSVPFCECKDEKTYKLFKNDILVARTGGTTGKSFLIDSPPSNSVFAGYLIRLRAKEDINPELIYEFLNSYVYWSQISEMKMGSAQPNVNAEKLKKLKIPLAPKGVLEQINNLLSGKQSDLSELESLIEKGMLGYNTSQNVSNLYVEQKKIVLKLRESILQEAVQGNLTMDWRANNPDTEDASIFLKRSQKEKTQLIKDKKIKKEKPLSKIKKEEFINNLPTKWEMTRLGEIGDWGAGSTPLRSNYLFYDGEINWFKSGELNNGLIDYESKEKITELALQKSSVKLNSPGDVLIAMYGATIGKTAILNVSGTTNQAVCACTPFSCITSFYLHILLKALKDTFINQGEGGAQPNISRVKIRNQAFALPPIEEQKAIVQKVNALMGLCDTLEQEVQQSQEHSAHLMQSVLREVFEPDNLN